MDTGSFGAVRALTVDLGPVGGACPTRPLPASERPAMAIDYSGVSNRSLLGRLVRLPLKLVPQSAKMRIRQGPLKGKRWIAGSHTHGCWLGSYEMDKQVLFSKHVGTGDKVLDIGANVGFYTLLSSHLVGPTGRVVAFEPVPRNLRYLHDHIHVNRLENVEVIEAAVGEKAGEIAFDDSSGSATGKISTTGRLRVPLVTVDELVAKGAVPAPTVLKIGVEGAEGMVLRGARRSLTAPPGGRRPIIFLATHGPAVHAECLALLREMGYVIASTNRQNVEQTDELLCT
jgi:FkbM family methyltransferase